MAHNIKSKPNIRILKKNVVVQDEVAVKNIEKELKKENIFVPESDEEIDLNNFTVIK